MLFAMRLIFNVQQIFPNLNSQKETASFSKVLPIGGNNFSKHLAVT